MAEKSQDKTAVEELERIGAPPYDNHSKLAIQRKWLERFGGVSHNNRLTFNDYLKIGLTSPDYSLLDGLRFFDGAKFSAANMWEERSHTNLFQEVPRSTFPFISSPADMTTTHPPS